MQPRVVALVFLFALAGSALAAHQADPSSEVDASAHARHNRPLRKLLGATQLAAPTANASSRSVISNKYFTCWADASAGASASPIPFASAETQTGCQSTRELREQERKKKLAALKAEEAARQAQRAAAQAVRRAEKAAADAARKAQQAAERAARKARQEAEEAARQARAAEARLRRQIEREERKRQTELRKAAAQAARDAKKADKYGKGKGAYTDGSSYSKGHDPQSTLYSTNGDDAANNAPAPLLLNPDNNDYYVGEDGNSQGSRYGRKLQ